MNFHDSIKSLAAHLAKIDENTYTDEDILLEDSRNLCNSLDGLGNNEHTLDDPSAAELFIKLHQMLDFCCKDSNSLNQLLGILKELGNNPKIRKHLQKMDFISLLANCLLNREMEENSEILCVLNKLTKGFRMETPEIFLISLIPFLVDGIVEAAFDRSKISLAILVNLCQSRPGIDILCKYCNTKNLTKKIITQEGYGLLALRILYGIGIYSRDNKIFWNTLLAIFREIDKLISQGDAESCQECFEFLLQLTDEPLGEYSDLFNQHVLKILERLQDPLDEAFVIAGLRLFSGILMAGHSLEDLHESLMDFALESLMKGSNVHVHALRLLQILGTENIELRSPSVERLNGMWKELATWLDQEAKSQSILKLISVFVRNPACQSSIISAVSREKIQKLLMIPTGEAIDKMKDDKILLLLTCLDLLTNFSTVEPLQWYGQADEAFKTPEIAKIIAEGFSRGHEEMFTCCLNLAQHTNFPRERITRLMHKSPVKRQTDCRRARPEDTFVPVQVLKKQSREIDRILKDFTNIPSNMTISSAAILMQHQIAYSKTVNRIHEQEIEHSQRFISSLKLQIATMEAERDSVRSLLSHYDITNEKAQRKIALCEETITSLQIALTQVNGKIEEDAKKLELARKEREEAKAKEKELKEAVRSLNSEVQEQKKSAEIMQKAMDEQKKEVTKKDARIQHLETKLKESESLRQRVVDLMMSGKIGN